MNEVAQKTLHNSEASGTRNNVTDVEFFGESDMWELICKASSQSEGWMKSTKAMEVPGGCLVQVTTQQRNADGSYALAEAVTFVPGVRIHDKWEANEHASRVIARTLISNLPS